MSWMSECQTPVASHGLAELQPLAEQSVALAPCHPASHMHEMIPGCCVISDFSQLVYELHYVY